MSDKPHAESHSGSTKNSKQTLTIVVCAFVLPVVLIIALLQFVGVGPKSSTALDQSAQKLAQAKRLQKVGAVEVRDADRPLVNGEEVYKNQCAACHATGVSGAPKFGDAAQWTPRLSQGFDALVHSALKGKGAMAPQGGGNFSDLEIARAVAVMANAAGAHFPEPQPPAKEGQ